MTIESKSDTWHHISGSSVETYGRGKAPEVRLFVPLGISLMNSIQDLPKSIGDTLPPTFSQKYLLHYAGSDAHTDWMTWGPKTQH
jgi:hypothetical protein